jgi:hypothetical protein
MNAEVHSQDLLNQGKIKAEVRTAVEAKKAEIKNQQEQLKNTAKTLRENEKEHRASTTAEIKDLRKDMKENRDDLRSDIVKIRVSNTARVITATITRLEKITERIQSRLTKVQANGGTTTQAQVLVDAAKVNIADAKVQVGIIASLQVGSTTSSTTAATNFEGIKAAAKVARESLESARQNLMKSVRYIQGLHLGDDKDREHATTTATTTNTHN